MAMTLEQALAFKVSGKQLRHMSGDDWRQWLKRIRAEHKMLNEMSGSNFTEEQDRNAVHAPLTATNCQSRFDVWANVRGGGPTGQAGAVLLGISRALVEVEPELELVLRAGGYLTRDPRMVERKKYGQRGARRRFQFSKR